MDSLLQTRQCPASTWVQKHWEQKASHDKPGSHSLCH
jgi:hypothetical protein